MSTPAPQISDVLLAMSLAPEATYNDMYLTGAGHFGLETRNRAFVVPDKEKTNNLGYVGSGAGAEFMTYQESGYLIPIPYEITGGLCTGWAGTLLRRAMGGTDTVTVIEAALVWQHVFNMQLNSSLSGRQLPSSSFVASLGAFDWLLGGVVVDTFQIRMPNDAVDPEFTATLINSGKRKRISEITSPAFGAVAQPVPQNFMKGAESVVQFTDTDSNGDPRTISLSGEKRFRNATMTLANNHRTNLRSAGDSRLDPASTRKGWYVSQMPHGDRTVTGEFTCLVDSLNREYRDADEDIPITNLIFRSRGHFVTGSTLNQYRFEFKIPSAFFNAPRGGGDPDAELTLGFQAARDPVTLGACTATLWTGSSAAIV